MNRSLSQNGALALGMAGLLLTTTLGACNSKGAPGPDPSAEAPSAGASPGEGSSDQNAAAAALPMSTTTPVAISSAPPVTALPAPSTMRVQQLPQRRDAYGYLDRAYYQGSAVEDGPPDYTFDDNGVRPWTWNSDNGSRVISEPVAGGYRTYYYQAGSDAPYLVRDPAYSYAYDNGALVAVFTLAGEQIALDGGAEQVNYGGRYYDRGTALYRYAAERPHLPVNAYVWNDRRGDLAAQRMAWHQQAANNPEWSAWDNAHRDDEERAWANDRAQHEAAAQQFGNWQQQRFQGQPPQFYGQPTAGDGRGPDRHIGAIVAGVAAAGVAAVAAHAIFGHHGHQDQHDQFQSNQGHQFGQQPSQYQGQPNQGQPNQGQPNQGQPNQGQRFDRQAQPFVQHGQPMAPHAVPAPSPHDAGPHNGAMMPNGAQGYHPMDNRAGAGAHMAPAQGNQAPHLMAPHNNRPAIHNAPPPMQHAPMPRPAMQRPAMQLQAMPHPAMQHESTPHHPPMQQPHGPDAGHGPGPHPGH